jgi:hypothetical protein
MSAIHYGMGVNQSMFRVGELTWLRYPVRVGGAGQFTGTFSFIGVAHKLTLDFFAWTPGSVMFGGLTSEGVPLPDATAQGSFNLTSYDGGGTVTLVSPSKISIDGTLRQRRTVAFTSLKLSFMGLPIPDQDGDGVWDSLDNCVSFANADQSDTDDNGVGDACNNDEDADGDEWADTLDNCPSAPNASQTDTDGESLGDACDPNPSDPKNIQAALDLNACLGATPDCSDGIDNDGDGSKDFPADAGCDSASDELETPLECSDGVDNDGDGLVDAPADGGCEGPDDPSEEADCADGLENDGDGLVDYPADPGCGRAGARREDPECSDGVDNDGDGHVDLLDPQCTAPSGTREAPSQGSAVCGLGLELALLLPPALALRSRKRGGARA